MPASSGPCPHHLGHDGERRGLPETAAGMRRSPPYPVSGGSSGACKERSEMAIGRSEDRDTPRNPAMLRHRVLVRDPIRETHLGQRSRRPHHKSLPSRKRGAGHMTATDQTRRSCTALARRGPSTYGFRAQPFGPPRNDVSGKEQFLHTLFRGGDEDERSHLKGSWASSLSGWCVVTGEMCPLGPV